MSASASPELIEFKREQTLINEFLWSSEIAYELVMQEHMTDDMRKSTRPLRAHLSKLHCNAFKATADPKKIRYKSTPGEFEDHLKRNFEAANKLVVVNIYRAYERFLNERVKLPSLDAGHQKELHTYLKSGASKHFHGTLKKIGVTVGPLSADLRNQFLDVEVYHQLRNSIAHGDSNDEINIGDEPWSDETLYKYCLENKNRAGRVVFPRNTTIAEREAAVVRVCDGARKKKNRWPAEPLIYFYTLFSLGAYHKLARSIDQALLR